MTGSIIEAISIALNAEFGDGYRVYPESVKQDLKEPCFFIFCLNPTHEQFLGKRYVEQNSFVIQYLPESRYQPLMECNATAERMKWCLEYITSQEDGRPIRGTGMRYEVVDEVLNFFVDYDGFVIRVEPDERMGNMESEIQAKKG